MSRCGVLIFLALLGGLVAAELQNSEASAQSTLACEPSEVIPGDIAICYIYVMDITGEPTTVFDPTDFIVQVKSRRKDVVPAFTDISVTSDPTVAKFTVTATAGTTLSVHVSLLSTGTEISQSGRIVYVLGQALRMGPISCDKDRLDLRDTTTCKTQLFGEEDTPAMVTKQDVYFSEDHGAGGFTFVEGDKNLIFTFQAPTFIMVNFSDFHIRLNLAGSSDSFLTQISLSYPAIPATQRSTVRCIDGSPEICMVNANDNFGPVRLDPSTMIVSFERKTNLSVGGDAVWVDYPAMNISWIPGNSLGTTRLFQFTMQIPNLVFNGRVNIGVIDPATNLTVPITGSPFPFVSGLAPSSDTSFFRSCERSIMLSLGMTSCYLEVDEEVIADPSYFSAFSDNGGTISTFTFSFGSNGRPRVGFFFTAPEVKTRTETYIYITARGGGNIQRSPFRVVVYPRKDTIEDPTKTLNDSTVGLRLLLGYLFFGGSSLLGIFVAIQLRKHHGHGQVSMNPLTMIKSARSALLSFISTQRSHDHDNDHDHDHDHDHAHAHEHASDSEPGKVSPRAVSLPGSDSEHGRELAPMRSPRERPGNQSPATESLTPGRRERRATLNPAELPAMPQIPVGGVTKTSGGKKAGPAQSTDVDEECET